MACLLWLCWPCPETLHTSYTRMRLRHAGTSPQVVLVEDLLGWNCEKAAEAHRLAAIQVRAVPSLATWWYFASFIQA